MNESRSNYDVFISYASPDVETAKYLCNTLEKNNINCWMAPRDILPGTEYGTAIINAIGECRIMVLVFSVCANQSPQVSREVERAVDKPMPIIPFRIQDTAPSGAMEFFISNAQWLDAFIPPLETHIQTLCASIRTILDQVKDGVYTFQRLKQKTQQSRKFAKALESIGAKFRELTEANTGITIETAANDREKVLQISRQLSQSLSKKGFQESENRKCVVVLKELLDNISAHSGDPEQRARISFRYGSQEGYPTLFMQIEDRGKGFDYQGTIDKLLSRLTAGEREHGLLRALRYGTQMTCDIKDTCAITWSKSQRPGKLESVFDGENIVVPVVFDYDEDLLRIHKEIYLYPEYCRFPGNPYFMDFVYEPLRRSSAPFVGYEVRGIHPTLIGLPSVSIWQSIWSYMQRRLPAKRLLVFADSNHEDHQFLNAACNRTGGESPDLSPRAIFFEDLDLCRQYLAKHRQQQT